MAKFGCPAKFIARVRQFHDGMLARVQNDGEFSDPFPATNGVKQGCVLASTLFSMMFSAMLTEGDTKRYKPPQNTTKHYKTPQSATTKYIKTTFKQSSGSIIQPKKLFDRHLKKNFVEMLDYHLYCHYCKYCLMALTYTTIVT